MIRQIFTCFDIYFVIGPDNVYSTAAGQANWGSSRLGIRQFIYVHCIRYDMVSGMIWYPVSSSSQCQYGRQMRGGQYCGIWIRATGETQGDFLGQVQGQDSSSWDGAGRYITARTRQSIDPWMTKAQGTTEYRVIEQWVCRNKAEAFSYLPPFLPPQNGSTLCV